MGHAKQNWPVFVEIFNIRPTTHIRPHTVIRQGGNQDKFNIRQALLPWKYGRYKEMMLQVVFSNFICDNFCRIICPPKTYKNKTILEKLFPKFSAFLWLR